MAPKLMMGLGIPLALIGILCNVALQSMIAQQRRGTWQGVEDRIEGRGTWEGFADVESPVKWLLLLCSFAFFPGIGMLLLGYFRM